MSKNKGKACGKYAETKTSAGGKSDCQRTGWPEDLPTQRVEDAVDQQAGKRRRMPGLAIFESGR